MILFSETIRMQPYFLTTFIKASLEMYCPTLFPACKLLNEQICVNEFVNYCTELFGQNIFSMWATSCLFCPMHC